MSAGEFFDLVRPAFLIVSALLSVFVLANAQRNGFRLLSSSVWAVTTFLLPLVTLPLYLIFRLYSSNREDKAARRSVSRLRVIGERYLLPFGYGLLLFTFIAFSQYREYNAIDAMLARAKQAKVLGDRQQTIREYKAALAMEDNPHTHKLLGIELYEDEDFEAALSELRLADRGGEDDPLLPFGIGVVLDRLNLTNQAGVEYKRFLYSDACTGARRNDYCEVAERKMAER
jgi:tetratricopeptide (TPR) repeat protein